jgi:hypothetical protein
MLNIQDIELTVALEDGEYRLRSYRRENRSNVTVFYYQEETRKIDAAVTLELLGEVTVGTVKVQVENHPFRENYNLCTKAPIKLGLELDEKPDRLCAAYQHRDWWSRPDFITSYSELPERTQSLFLKGEKNYGYILPMVGSKTKTYITKGCETKLVLEMTSYCEGLNRVEDLCFLLSESENLFDAIKRVFDKAASIKQIPLKEDRVYPEMFEYFGWCSWDAFYTDITEAKVLEKVKEFADKQIPVRWILLDDGWLNTENQCLKTFEPNFGKFPNEFKEMTRKIKAETMIQWIGVWHAFAGYWGGIAPDSKLALELEPNLYQTKTGRLLPHYDPEKGYDFWNQWYQYLDGQGIDFVKVDGQSALKNYYKNNEEIAKVASGSHESLERAVKNWMNGNIINCMGMAVENIFSRPSTCISRNSDDFVPMEENGFREHILENSYNALYHDRMYVCDWDMYWTNHPEARKHALVRAISGGPIYVSDRIGETSYEEIMPLVYRDGKILRMDRCALPALDCIFQSPLEGGNALKLTNTVNNTGAIAAFHISEKAKTVEAKLSPADIHDLQGELFGAYDYFRRSFIIMKRDEAISVKLAPKDYSLVLFLPLKEQVTPIGLINKYMSAHAVKSLRSGNKQTEITLTEGGEFAFYKAQAPKCVLINGADRTEEVVSGDGYFCINLSDCMEKVSIIIE